MDKFKTILEWGWLIVKLIFMLAAIIIGVKLIILLMFPILPFSLYTNFPFNSFDWNPIATLVGALVTGGIAWYAVDRTAKLDRKNRINEFKYKHYIENLDELKKNILLIDRLNFYFDKNSSCLINRNLDDAVLNKDFEIRQVQKLYKHLCKINPSFQQKTMGFDNTLKAFDEIYKFLKKEIKEHNQYLETNKEDFRKSFINKSTDEHVYYIGEDFLRAYKDFSGKDYNVVEMINALDNIINLIEEEFVMDEK